MSQIKWVIVAELLLDSGTQYVSGERVRRTGSPDTVIYSGTVLRWGSIEKSIPCPSGMPQISGATIRIADRYRKWRDLLCQQTPRRRLMRITVLPEGASLADCAPVFVGEVVDVTFLPACIEVSLKDRQFAWLDEPIPAMAIPELYPDIAPKDRGGFISITNGRCRSLETSPHLPEGVIPCPHIGVIGAVDRYAAAATEVYNVVAVYRREDGQVNVDIHQTEWVLVDPSEYTISTHSFTAEENPYGSFGMTHTYIDFLTRQPEGTEIRADIDGINSRGAWGSLPAAGGSPPELLRNPIDFFINMTFFILSKAGSSLDVFDTDEISALRDQFETGFGSPPEVYYCDRAITQAMTAREWLGQFLASFNLDMFVNKRGLITLRFINDELDTERPVFKEGKHLLKESFIERLPEHVANQVQFRYNFNNATGEFETVSLADNTDEQDLLAIPDGDEKIEKEVVDFYDVRDATTAAAMADLRNQFMQLGSYRQEFQLPAPAVFDDIELAEKIGLTHSMGLEIGGYLNRQAKILGVTLDLDQLIFTIRTVLWPPQTVLTGSVLMEGEQVRPLSVSVWDDDPPVNASRSSVDDPELAIDADGAIGESTTEAVIHVNSTRCCSESTHLRAFDVPEPTDAFTHVEFHASVKIWGSGILYGSYPIAEILVFDQLTDDHIGDPGYPDPKAVLWSLATSSDDIALTDYSATMTAAEFAAAFPSGASQIYFRFKMWSHSTMDVGTPSDLPIDSITKGGDTAIVHWATRSGSFPMVGNHCVITGCSNSANNGTFKIIAESGGSQEFTIDNPDAVDEPFDSPGLAVTVTDFQMYVRDVWVKYSAV